MSYSALTVIQRLIGFSVKVSVNFQLPIVPVWMVISRMLTD